MNKYLVIILASAMVLNLTSCSTMPGSSAKAYAKTVASDQAGPQKTQSEESVLQKSEADVTQDPNYGVDPLSARFNGLWITFSSIGTLYYFDNGVVTNYSKVNYDSPTDLHYKVIETQHYVVEKVTSQAGSGLKAVLDNGNEYWLLDDYPDELSLHWYDENHELQYSGSGSLMRVTDFTVDDLILGDAALTSYADVVRQY